MTFIRVHEDSNSNDEHVELCTFFRAWNVWRGVFYHPNFIKGRSGMYT